MPLPSRSLRAPLGFAAFVGRRLMTDNCVQVAASLTFTTLLSLVPLFTIALIVVSAFPVFSSISAQVKIFLLTNLVPDFAGKVITVYMRQFTDNAGKLTAVGLVVLGATALSLMFTIDRAFNAIWRVTKPRPLMQKMLVYWTVLTLGPLLLGGGLSLSAWLLKASGVGKSVPLVAALLQDAGSLLLTTLMLTVLYGLVPNRHVPLKHALTGAAAGAVLLELTKGLFALYLQSTKSYQFIYGAFASFPILLLWLQMLWLVVLFGAVLTASLSYWRGGAWQRKFETHRGFRDAVEALRCLYRAQLGGTALTQQDFRRHIDAGFDEIGTVLDELRDAGMVQRGERDRWALLRRAEDIRLIELYRRFVLDPGAGHDDVSATLARLLAPLDEVLGLTLVEFDRRVEGDDTAAPRQY